MIFFRPISLILGYFIFFDILFVCLGNKAGVTDGCDRTIGNLLYTVKTIANLLYEEAND